MRQTDMRLTEISTALDSVRARLAAACLAAGREVSDVALLPVTKFFPASDARILYELGCREFGESREQEAVEKVADFDGAAQSGAIDDPVRWHMIGQLQRNKARSVAKWAYAIHSVDSARLADALDRAALGALSDGERTSAAAGAHPGKSRRRPCAWRSSDGRANPSRRADRISRRSRICGTDGRPAAWMPIRTSSSKILRRAHLSILESHPRATELSAGMTGDLEAAVRHGSTCVRVGTALLGSRPVISR